MKRIILSILILQFYSCGESSNKSTEQIAEPALQRSLFEKLVLLTKQNIPDALQNDSLSFLILPVQASCPACRKKTIDSIVKHQNKLDTKHYIIISSSGGRKIISSYFKEQNYDLPENTFQFFLDSTNLAKEYNLYKDKPTMYYSCQKKVYKKVAAIPATVREDLCEFFSGYRYKTN